MRKLFTSEFQDSPTSVGSNGEIILDLSHKDLERIDPIPPTVTVLILNHNFIRRLENLVNLKDLEQLSISYNKLHQMHGVSQLYNLTILNLPGNCIATIDGLSKLRKLRWLNLSGNHLRTIEQLESNIELRHLDLSENYISELKNLKYLYKLKTLLLHCNSICSIGNAPKHLPASLVILSLASNIISDLNEAQNLKQFSNLAQLSLQNNPCTLNVVNYEHFVETWLPQLVVLDGNQINRVVNSVKQMEVITLPQYGKTSLSQTALDKRVESLNNFDASQQMPCVELHASSQYVSDKPKTWMQQSIQLVDSGPYLVKSSCVNNTFQAVSQSNDRPSVDTSSSMLSQRGELQEWPTSDKYIQTSVSLSSDQDNIGFSLVSHTRCNVGTSTIIKLQEAATNSDMPCEISKGIAATKPSSLLLSESVYLPVNIPDTVVPEDRSLLETAGPALNNNVGDQEKLINSETEDTGNFFCDSRFIDPTVLAEPIRNFDTVRASNDTLNSSLSMIPLDRSVRTAAKRLSAGNPARSLGGVQRQQSGPPRQRFIDSVHLLEDEEADEEDELEMGLELTDEAELENDSIEDSPQPRADREPRHTASAQRAEKQQRQETTTQTRNSPDDQLASMLSRSVDSLVVSHPVVADGKSHKTSAMMHLDSAVSDKQSTGLSANCALTGDSPNSREPECETRPLAVATGSSGTGGIQSPGPPLTRPPTAFQPHRHADQPSGDESLPPVSDTSCPTCGLQGKLLQDHIIALRGQLKAQCQAATAEANLRQLHSRAIEFLLNEVQALKTWRQSVNLTSPGGGRPTASTTASTALTGTHPELTHPAIRVGVMETGRHSIGPTVQEPVNLRERGPRDVLHTSPLIGTHQSEIVSVYSSDDEVDRIVRSSVEVMETHKPNGTVPLSEAEMEDLEMVRQTALQVMDMCCSSTSCISDKGPATQQLTSSGCNGDVQTLHNHSDQSFSEDKDQ